VISANEEVPTKKFIYFVYEDENRSGSGRMTPRDRQAKSSVDSSAIPRLSLGYAATPENGVRRTSTALPGHTTLMARTAGYKTVDEVVVDVLKGELDSGRFGGGGFMVTDTHVIMNPYYSLKSAGALESSLGYDVAVKYGDQYHLPPLGFFEPTTINPNLVRPDNTEPSLVVANDELDTLLYKSQLPAHLWQPVFNEIVQRVGKPIQWDPDLVSDHFKWNADKKLGPPSEKNITLWSRINSIIQPLVEPMIREANKGHGSKTG
jgi:hypothetical protein